MAIETIGQAENTVFTLWPFMEKEGKAKNYAGTLNSEHRPQRFLMVLC